MRVPWATASLLAVAILLGLYLVLIDNPRERAKAERQDQEGKVVAIAEDDVSAIEIVRPGRRLVLERGSDGVWRLISPQPADADEGTVRRLLTQLASLSAIRPIQSDANPSELGLDDPDLRVTARRSSGPVTLAFGAANPDESGVYVRRDDGRIFLVAAASKSTFDVSEDDVRRREFLSFDPQSVTGITIAVGKDMLRLKREGHEWVMSDPDRPADPAKVSSLLGRLRALRATAFVDSPDQRAAVRLLPLPRARVELTLETRNLLVAFHETGDRKGLYARTGDDKLYQVSGRVLDDLPLAAGSFAPESPSAVPPAVP
ncbi:MAG: DUF4340 domain-containing protein [Nitrospiria bacterium]